MNVNKLESSAEEIINIYSDKLAEKNYNVSAIIKKTYNFEFTVNDSKHSIKVLTYFGKKGIKTILQGNTESALYHEVNELIHGIPFTQNNTEIDEPESYIGTDESGKGDFFGPLVIAGVYAGKNEIQKLRSIGVRDSKEIPHNQIADLAKKIKLIAGDGFNIVVINPERYNQLYTEFKNLNMLLAWGHARVIENILEKKSAAEVISDKFGDESLILNKLQERGKQIKLHQFTKAERYTAVAAASIIARDRMNKWFDDESRKLKFIIPKGASEAVLQTAAKIKSEFGEEELKKFVKLHFKSINKLNSVIGK